MRVWFLLLIATLPLLVGCAMPYLVRQTSGQVKLWARAEPLSRAERDETRSAEERKKLAEVGEILEFADQVGLDVDGQYRTFVDLRGKPLVLVLLASPPDRLESHLWHYPIVGAVPYKGFFDIDAVRREKRVLESRGLETLVRPAPAYSLLGWFDDPIYSSMLESTRAELAETLFHELTHATVFYSGDARFNENLANFVGKVVARRYLAGSPDADEYERLLADRDRFRRITGTLKQKLTEAFEAEEREVRLAQRDVLFAEANQSLREAQFTSERYRGFRSIQWNTPMVMSLDLYSGEEPLFQQALESLDGDISALLKVVEGLPARDKGIDALAEWVARHADTTASP